MLNNFPDRKKVNVISSILLYIQSAGSLEQELLHVRTTLLERFKGSSLSHSGSQTMKKSEFNFGLIDNAKFNISGKISCFDLYFFCAWMMKLEQ